MALFSIALTLQAQENGSKKAGPASAVCKFSDGKTIKTLYSSQRSKGRRVFGGIVAYGEVWHAGGDEPITFDTDSDLTIGDQEIPAGTYALFTIPAADKWTLIISRQTGTESNAYSRSKELLRTDMQVSSIASWMDNFTIAYDSKEGKCTLKMTWENTQASINLAEKKLCWPTTSPLTYQCPDE